MTRQLTFAELRDHACACARCERTRVREHLLGAVYELMGRRDVAPEVAGRRQALIGALLRYAIAGVFPINVARPDARVPIFVDDGGRRCAVAHLLELTGQGELVQDVARTANGAFVPELVADPRLLAWLDANGLTVAEAARVQPCYSCPSFDPVGECACSMPLSALVVGTFTIDPTTDAFVITVDASYGAATVQAGSIIDNWTPGHVGVVGVQVLLAEVGVGSFLALHPIESDGVELQVVVHCTPTCFVQSGPNQAPLEAFISVAEGIDCRTAFAGLPGWEYQPSSTCGPSSTGEGGADSTGSVSSGGDSDADGCSCRTTPVEGDYALLWALAAGIAVARRRSRRKAP